MAANVSADFAERGLTQVKASPQPRHDTVGAVDAARVSPGRRACVGISIGAVILILLGVIFLLVNLDIAPAAELKTLMTKWWPLLLIVVGVLAIMRPRSAS